MNDVTAGHIDFSGNAITTDAMVVTNLDSGRFGVAGCGWIIDAQPLILTVFTAVAQAALHRTHDLRWWYIDTHIELRPRCLCTKLQDDTR